MTAESLWDLFARTGLPEAYSLYRQTVSAAPKNSCGVPVPPGGAAADGPANHIPGT